MPNTNASGQETVLVGLPLEGGSFREALYGCGFTLERDDEDAFVSMDRDGAGLQDMQEDGSGLPRAHAPALGRDGRNAASIHGGSVGAHPCSQAAQAVQSGLRQGAVGLRADVQQQVRTLGCCPHEQVDQGADAFVIQVGDVVAPVVVHGFAGLQRKGVRSGGLVEP